ncbi:hypothetical protein ACFU67_13440 [Streptomyces rhizosphaericola]|uniref:hypothetical protein n=1 Tax=Streptomyces rhizosphaericola TaxID=2564098 RepID=UPI0036CB5433
MTPRTETVTVSHYLCDTPVITGPVANTLVRSLHLDRPRDLNAERDYADSVTSGYVTLPAGCSIPRPEPTADDLNRLWGKVAASKGGAR